MNTTITPTPVLGWHFLRVDGRLSRAPYTIVEVGQTLTLPPDTELQLCRVGYHASMRAIDALYYAPGPIACRVSVTGDIQHGPDKLCASSRTVIAMTDATKLLHEFACDCAEQMLASVTHPDARSIAAVDAKRAWLRGEIDDARLAAARAAAAWDAAWAASHPAAQFAAGDASEAAARAAAQSASESAAGEAARDAAWYAAYSAARSAQNADLESRLIRAMGLA